jgi:hypothetical protein
MTASSNPLVDAVAETFGGMAFIDTIVASDNPTASRSQLFSIEVRGESTHSLVLDLPVDLKQQIVENIHATSWDELSSGEIDDCLLEFLNVLGGAYGRMLWGDDSRYKLSFPEVAVSIRDPEPSEEYSEVNFDAYGTIFTVHLFKR